MCYCAVGKEGVFESINRLIKGALISLYIEEITIAINISFTMCVCVSVCVCLYVCVQEGGTGAEGPSSLCTPRSMLTSDP